MSARDDLVAAMEAKQKYEAYLHNIGGASLKDHQHDAHLAAYDFLHKHGKHLLAHLDADPVAAALRERDRIMCEAIMEVCGHDLKLVSALLGAINKRRTDILPTYWCDKCGYSGSTGPKHDGCDYHAAFSSGSEAARPEASDE